MPPSWGSPSAALLGAGLIVLWLTGVIEFAGRVALAALVVAVALILISAPFWRATFNRLGAERVARARADERADVAAHLHDSVLQTLALIQKRSDDPEQVGRLARRQERELRDWLSDTEPSRPDERLADALRAAAAEIEDSHGAPIEAVVVGDAELNERLEALVAASREALTNSAKFASEGGPVRLYAEIEKGGARVFIDDRGPGFDPESIPADRRGVRESIIGRMERYGGTRGDPQRSRRRHGGRADDEGAPMSTPSVVIVDDHAIFRAGVKAELGEGVEVLGEAESVEDAVRAIAELEPDVVLLDVHMPGGGGVEVIGQVAKQRPQQRFLALSVSDDPQDVIAIVRAGARGYVTKTITGDELADAVRAGPRRRRGLLAATGRLRARRLRRRPARGGGRPRARPAHRPRARGAPLHRARLPLQGDRAAAPHLGEDRRGARQLGAPQAAALQPPRAQPLGGQPPAGRLGSNGAPD